MAITEIFSIPIFTQESALSTEHHSRILSDVLKRWKRQFEGNFESFNATWQSTPTLMNEDFYFPLTRIMIETYSLIFKYMKWEERNVEITSMWSNVLSLASDHEVHNHSNSIISFVYYLQCTEGDSICFLNPNIAANTFQPTTQGGTSNNCKAYRYHVKAGTLIAFPSYLYHFVENRNKDSLRVSIAANSILRGELSVQKSLQSLKL